jgi:hypothetical protein
MGAPVDCAICGQPTTAAGDREAYMPARTLRFDPRGVNQMTEPFELTVSSLAWVCEDCTAFANRYEEE